MLSRLLKPALIAAGLTFIAAYDKVTHETMLIKLLIALVFSAVIGVVVVIISFPLYKLFPGFFDTREEKARKRIGIDGFTELMHAAGSGDVDSVTRLLFEDEIGVNLQDMKGGTALMYAVMNNHINIAQLLLAKGADPTIATKKGLTALRIAKNKRFKKIYALLQANCELAGR